MLEPVESSTRPDPASPYDARPWLASYPPGVPASVTVPPVPLTRLLDDATSSFPKRTALTWEGTRLTYLELRDVADHLAAGLARIGVGKGDRVAVLLPDCPQLVLTVFAVLRLGAVVVPADPEVSSGQLRELLLHTGVTVAVCLDRAHGRLARARAGTEVRTVVVTSLVDYLPVRRRMRLRLPTPRARSTRSQLAPRVVGDAAVVPFVRLLKSARAARQTAVEPGTDVAVLHVLRDVTGELHSVAVTHRHLVSTALVSRAWDRHGRPGEDVVVGAVPLHTLPGLTACLNATVLLGGKLVLHQRAEPAELVAAVERHRATVLVGTPAVLDAVAQHAVVSGHDLHSLRLVVSEGFPLPADTQRTLERLAGAPVVVGRGLTEQGPSLHRTANADRRRSDALGLPLPGTECKIVDPRCVDRELPVGQRGELLLRGPHVVPGGHGSGGVTADGYLRTGQLAAMDEDGVFVLAEAARGDEVRAPQADGGRKSTAPSRRSA